MSIDKTAQGADRLGDFLVRQSLITVAQLQAALRIQEKYQNKYKLGKILVDQKVLDPQVLAEILATQKRLRAHEKGADTVIKLPPLPESVKTIAALDGTILYVAQGQQGYPAIQSWLYDAKRQGATVVVETCDMQTLAQIRALDSPAGNIANLPSVRQIRRIVADAVARKASDIHFTLHEHGGNGYLDIQYRIKGDIITISQLSESLGGQMIGALFQSMSTVADATVIDNEDQNAIITQPILLRGDDGRDLGLVGIRLAKSPLIHGRGVSARLLYRQAADDGQALDRLGYSRRQIAILDRLTQQNMGINPFTGPTGSGKSTTLAAQIRAIRKRRPGLRILTIEDPVEYEFNDPNIWQFYVANANSDEDKSKVFAGKLKAALREDPDIIMVGEIRGIETAREAMTAAITGHQIWTTLHVSDPFMIPQRLIMMGVDAFYLRDTRMLSSLIAQRLMKALCPHCAIPLTGHEDRLERETIEHLRTWVTQSPYADLSGVRLRGAGCAHCDHQGVAGRTVVAQVIPTDEELLETLIHEGPAKGRRLYMARPDAEIDMVAHGVLKVLAGEIDPRDFQEVLDPVPKRPTDLRPLTLEDV